MSSQSLRIATWNLEWARPSTHRGKLLRSHLQELAADILCITEGSADMLPDAGYTITSEADYGYSAPSYRRKVLLWSREPWFDIDPIGNPNLPSGRFIAGTTLTPLGQIRIFGTCIPWRDAHVNTGRRDRTRWQDHLSYLETLPTVLSDRPLSPAIWLGDFNQRIPPKAAPVEVQTALEQALKGWQVATAGEIAPLNKVAIDHIVYTADFQPVKVFAQSQFAADGTRLSDHFGVIVDFQLSSS